MGVGVPGCRGWKGVSRAVIREKGDAASVSAHFSPSRFTMPGYPKAAIRHARRRTFMRRLHSVLQFALIISVGFVLNTTAAAQKATAPEGIFEGHSDVGTVLHPGSVDYDAAAKTYTISGSGENMWFAADAFQFAWKKDIRGRDPDRGHFIPEQERQRAQEGRADAAAKPGCRFRLCRRGTPRQRPDLAAIPRRKGRSHARDPIEPLRPEAAAHRQARRLRLHVSSQQTVDLSRPADGCAFRCKGRSTSGSASARTTKM